MACFPFQRYIMKRDVALTDYTEARDFAPKREWRAFVCACVPLVHLWCWWWSDYIMSGSPGIWWCMDTYNYMDYFLSRVVYGWCYPNPIFYFQVSPKPASLPLSGTSRKGSGSFGSQEGRRNKQVISLRVFSRKWAPEKWPLHGCKSRPLYT